MESLDEEIKRIIFESSFFTKENYLFLSKRNFSTSGCNLEIIPRSTKNVGTQTDFIHGDTIRDLLG